MTSMQAVSGAGYPGVASLDVLGNVIPSIAGEEEKLPEEVPKMLGTLSGDRIEPAPALVSATCTRVPVLDGHLESVSVRLRGDPGLSDVEAALRDWAPLPQQLGLPSAPVPPLRLHRRADRPQPRLDASVDGGMPVHVGNLRRCPVLGVKLTVLGHNTERGAAGGSVLNAELAMARGLIGEVVVHQAESREP